MTILPKFLITVLLFLSCSIHMLAQELKCQVEINTSEVEGTSTQIFKTLQDAISEYMNTNSFSRNRFAPNEKIECRLFFNIKEINDDNIKAELQVQSTRPVYNSTYTTNLLNFKDNNVQFSYREFEPLVFSQTNMESQLTAILNFYAYLILALDYDSFSPLGGQEFYDRARNVALMAQSAGESGWRMFEDNRNRSAVLSAYIDPATSKMRNILYDYHRKGLDEMAGSPDKARGAITKSITEDLKGIYEAAPMSVALNLFHDSKLDEIINIYSRGTEQERKNVEKVLEEIYPTDQSRLQQITKVSR